MSQLKQIGNKKEMLGLGFRHENRNNETASDFAQDLKKSNWSWTFLFRP